MTCNKQLCVKLRVRKCNNSSKEKINRIREQSNFVYVAAAPLPRMPISFLDKSRNLELITFQLLRTSHLFYRTLSFMTVFTRVLHLCLSLSK